MRLLSLLAVATLAIAVAGCNSADHASKLPASSAPSTNPGKTTQPAHTDSARRINVTEAHDLISKAQAVIIDVRNQAAYDTAHIRGAKLIPFNEVADRVNELPRNKTIITYCS